MKDPGGSAMVEADIVINGVALSFGESMTVRVALGSFLMYVSDPQSAHDLGSIADGYRNALNTILKILHDPIIAEHERRRQERGMTRKEKS